MQLNIMQCLVALAHGGAERLALTILNKGRNKVLGRVCGLMRGTGSLIPEIERLSLPYDVLCASTPSRLAATRQLIRILRRNRVDILHVQAAYLLSFVLPAALLANTRIVYTEHAKYSLEHQPLLRHTVRLAAPFLHAITCVSQDLKNFMVDRVGINADRIRVIPNGVDTNTFSPSVTPPDSSFLPVTWNRSECFVFGNVARFTDAKDHPNLLRAFDALRRIRPEVRLVMVGDGETRPQVEELIRELDLVPYVHLAGMRDDIPRVLRTLDAFVLSSKREGMPVSVLEAAAAGIPVVTTDVGGIREVLADGHTALIVPPMDTEALCKAMVQMTADHALCQRFAMAAGPLVREQYSHDRMVNAYIESYANRQDRT